MRQFPSANNSLIYRFDAYCKKVLKNHSRNIRKMQKRKWKKEILVGDDFINDLVSELNEYEEVDFIVDDLEITVKNELLLIALKKLPEKKCDIILLSFYLDMTDEEIADRLMLKRATVNYHKRMSLKNIRNYMEVDKNDRK